jgi:hypothetical protein
MKYRYHEIPGRIRLQLPQWKGCRGNAACTAETVSRLSGVESASVNPLTGSLIVHFDSTVTSSREILGSVFSADSPELVHALSTGNGGGTPSQVGNILLRAACSVLAEQLLKHMLWSAVQGANPLTGLWLNITSTGYAQWEWLKRVIK